MRTPNLLLVLIAAAGSGCFGGSQNPSYVPFYLPTGDVVRTHAKPPGFGYFANFDRKATKIEVSPASVTNPTKSQQVLIATVYDKDGTPRRARRVEWILDGPGNIIEVDESGYLQGRGYKVDNKYGVSYTDYLEHTITRGNDDPKDDFTVKPGQTWCVVSSAVEGQTTVTAYAPEVYDWDQGRAFAKLVWNDAEFAATPPAVARSNGDAGRAASLDKTAAAEVTLDAKLPIAVPLNQDVPVVFALANRGRADGQAVTVRTTIPDDTDFVKADPQPSRQSGRDVIWTVPGLAGGAKQDLTLVVRPSRKGRMDVAATAESADGSRAERRASTTVETGGVKVTAVAAGNVVRVTASNPGAVPLANVIAWLTPADGLTHASGADPVELAVGPLEPGKSRTVEAAFAAAKPGSYVVKVNATAENGLADKAETRLTFARTGLGVTLVGPDTFAPDQEAYFEAKVTNTGDGPVANARVSFDIPREWTPVGPTSRDVGTLTAGETKTARFGVTAARPADGKTLIAAATADLPAGGTIDARDTAKVSAVGTPVLVLELTPPAGPVAVGGRTAYRVVVRNRGTGPAKTVDVSLDVSTELKPVRGDGPRDTAATIDGPRVKFAVIDDLPAGATATFQLDADAVTAGDARVAAEVRSAELARPLHEDQVTRVKGRR